MESLPLLLTVCGFCFTVGFCLGVGFTLRRLDRREQTPGQKQDVYGDYTE